MSFHFLLKHLLTLFCPVLLVAGALPAQGEAPSTAFGKKGPYSVTMSEVSDQGLLLVPHSADGTAEKKQWPGIVFGHGLCGPARGYTDTLERLCSWGFVIIANQQQEDCGVLNIRRPLQSLRSRGKFQYAANSSIMAGNITKNLHYLASRSDVNPDALALVGHSMGGGVSIDVGTAVNTEQPGYVKAVIGIAPWNGARPVPSSVVAKLGAPLLLFCSSSDSLCPCSGAATVSDSQGPFTSPAVVGIPMLFGGGADVYWNGGVDAIYKNARTAILMQVKKVSHFTIAGTDGKQMENLAYQSTNLYGLNFNHPRRPYAMIPTLEYSVGFLYDVLNIDRQRGKTMLARAEQDNRIDKVLSK